MGEAWDKEVFKIKTYRVALYEIKVILCSVKFLVISAVSWVFMDMFLMEIRKFALDYDLRVIPAALPFYFSDDVYCNIAFLLLIFLFSDLPLKDSSQRQLMQRCGFGKFAGGQMAAIVGVSAVFVVEQFLFSVLSVLSCIGVSDWGKVWGSVAAGKLLELGYGNYVRVSAGILAAYTPWQAILMSAVLFFLTGVCYGMLIFFFNAASRGKAGTALLSLWSLGWIFLQGAGSDRLRFLNRFSPQRWNDLSGKEGIDVVGTAAVQLIFIVVIFLINRMAVKKRKIEVI